MNYIIIGMNCMHVHHSGCIFFSFWYFPKTAWQAVHSR